MVTSAEDLDKCSKFIKEVRVLRFTKLKERQVRKFSTLLASNINSLDNNRSARNNTRQANNATSNNNNNNRDIITNDKWVINLSKQLNSGASICIS